VTGRHSNSGSVFSLAYVVFNTLMNLRTQEAQIACFQNVGRLRWLEAAAARVGDGADHVDERACGPSDDRRADEDARRQGAVLVDVGRDEQRVAETRQEEITSTKSAKPRPNP